MCYCRRQLLHHICASQANNDNVHQGSNAISDDKNIHLFYGVMREKVGNLAFNMCSTFYNNNCNNILKCIMGYRAKSWLDVSKVVFESP
jgi:hypothetical protein